MKPVTVQNLIPNGTVLNANRTGVTQQCANALMMAIQIAWTGTPNGVFYLECSCDPYQSGVPGWPINWGTISGSTYNAIAAGNYTWNISYPGYNYIRVRYTDSSGGTSTAVMSDATINIKGF